MALKDKPRRVNRTYKTLIAILACIVAPGPAQHAHMTPVRSAYLKMVFVGDVSGAADLFASEPDDRGSSMLVDRFERRFKERTDGLDLTRIESSFVRDIAELFQSYWFDALTQEAALDDEDTLLENVEAFIRGEGYFAQSGRTPPLLDLMIWTDNKTTVESVELTDGTYDI